MQPQDEQQPQAPQERVRNLIYTCPVDHDGTSVFVKGWLIPDHSHDPIVLLHDLGETAECMAPIASLLAQQGFSVYCFDMRGHGQSGRRLGHIPSFHQLVLDLLQVVAWVKHKAMGRKPIIIGHGMGALVALFFAKGYSKFCQAMVLASPIFALSDNTKPYKRFVIKTLADWRPMTMLPQSLCPTFTGDMGAADKRKGRSTPKISALLAFELLTAISQSRKIFLRHRLPTLILYPKDDPICKYDFLRRMISKHKYHDYLQLVAIESSHHQLLTDPLPQTLDLLVKEVQAWLATNPDKEKKPASKSSPHPSHKGRQNLPLVEESASTIAAASPSEPSGLSAYEF